MNHPWDKIVYREITDSTNLDAITAARKEEGEGTFFHSDYQHNGRGRNGRKWISSSGSGLLFSFILRGDYSLKIWSQIGLVSAFGVCSSLREFGFEAEIKWPNDIFLSGRKVCGILCESFREEHFSVIGIGINLRESPQHQQAISLSEEGEIPLLEDLFSSLRRFLFSSFQKWRKEDFLLWDMEDWDYLKGKRIQVFPNEENFIEAEVIRIQNDGSLLLANGKLFSLYSVYRIRIL